MIRVFLLLTLPFLAQAAFAAEPAAKPPPNILFCFADDWGRYASILSLVESRPSLNQVVQTPNIDRIAKEGALFRNAFVNSPSCTPCRSALLSGRYFFNTGRGAILNGAVWDEKIPAYPLLLRDAGYHIGKSYKVWSPGTPADAPFGGQQYAYEKAGRTPNNFSETVTKAMQQGTSLADARARIYHQVRGNFEAFLRDRKAGQPWHYWFGPTTTHRTWIKGSGKALWGIEPDALNGKLPDFLPDVPEVRADLADYLGEVQAFDAYIGVLLEILTETGQLDQTLIVVSGDHGMPGVPGGKCNLYDFGTGVMLAVRPPGQAHPRTASLRVIDDMVLLMDLAPTFLEAAGVSLPDGMNGQSLWPQITSGKSGQIDPSRTAVITGRERHVGSAREGNRPYPMRALRTADFLYIRNFEPDRWPMGSPAPGSDGDLSTEELETNTRATFADMDAGPTKAWVVQNRQLPAIERFYDYAFGKRPSEELYDLRSDPHQFTNVATLPAFLGKKEELAAQLLQSLTQAGDPRVSGPDNQFEKPPFTAAAEPRAPKRNQQPPN